MSRLERLGKGKLLPGSVHKRTLPDATREMWPNVPRVSPAFPEFVEMDGEIKIHIHDRIRPTLWARQEQFGITGFKEVEIEAGLFVMPVYKETATKVNVMEMGLLEFNKNVLNDLEGIGKEG